MKKSLVDNTVCGLYIRISREETEDHRQSIQTQKNLLDKYFQENNLKIYDYYIDEGISGQTLKRPNFIRLLDDIKYKKIADYTYNSLINKRSDNSNIIKYNNDECNYVDVLGMIVPFLMEYYELSGEILAYNIAKENLEEYYKYGVDKETGFPAHGYNLKSKIKLKKRKEI